MKIPFALLTVVVVGLQGFARGEFIDASLSAKLTPIADANLKAMRKTLKEFGDGMKDFRQRLLFSANRTISF